ncbi:hypothetical protein HY3_00130 [Hyphomonas pacifica]|uniref:Ketoreductase domain-containing protein n=2 Tax=Hyphomonas pacifica TaxID=1280941 RepID=A0A062U938_9PROT|nr:hypothetical protein HY2_00945 [Hyphomonas pacifica]RAN36017.1 hypothetical protein HY3_00130 [Hyphomonas pacifica]
MQELGIISVTEGAPELASGLVQTLRDAGATACLQDSAQAVNAAYVIMTEGLSEEPITERHWRVLETCRRLQHEGRKLILLERAQADELTHLSGLQGLSRTLSQEWPGTDIVTWSLEGRGDADFPGILQALSSGFGDVIFAGQHAYELKVSGASLQSRCAQSDRNVWFVSGGGRGVTASCVSRLARMQPDSVFLLAGRSPIVEWPQHLPVMTDIKSLRMALIQDAKARGLKPALPDIDRQAKVLLASAEIRQTLNAIETAGAEAVYLRTDVSDADGLKHAMQDAVAQYGPVTGLIHGAGVLADSLADKKTPEDVQRVFLPKVEGLLSILACLDISRLRHVGLFSSAAAVFGNVGQSDYAMANAWLNAVARELSHQLSDAIVKSFCWGPWEGGMVDDTLAAHFAQRGIQLISLEDGARIFADQILFGEPSETELVIGDEWTS